MNTFLIGLLLFVAGIALENIRQRRKQRKEVEKQKRVTFEQTFYYVPSHTDESLKEYLINRRAYEVGYSLIRRRAEMIKRT